MLIALTLAAAAAPAAAPLRLETRVLAEERVAAPDGTTRIALTAPKRVVPGDRVVVEVAYRNAGAQPIAGLVIANPLPRGLAYRAPYAATPAPELSVDGRTFGPLATLRVPGAGGERAATLADVTHVRWHMPTALPAGAGGTLAIQAVIQ